MSVTNSYLLFRSVLILLPDMLRINQHQSLEGARSYFDKELRAGDYYAKDQERAGEWGGKISSRLGLGGQVRREPFFHLCAGLHPGTGEKLTPRLRADRTVGYDFNFHPPKSVSVVAELTGDERIVEAFRQTVQEAMQEIETYAAARVRRGGRSEDRTTGELCWAEFVHFTTRPVGGIPDPHLHCHIFVPNLTWDAAEDRFKAGQFRPLVEQAPYFEQGFHARLAGKLRMLGYGIEFSRRGWEIAGVPASVLRKFSQRTAIIEQAAAERDIAGAEAKARLGAATRERKTRGLTRGELRAIWRDRLDADEAAALTALLGQPPVSSAESAASALDQAIGHCFERASAVPVATLLREALRFGKGWLGTAEIHAEFNRRDFITCREGRHAYVTTPALLAEENAAIRFVRATRGGARPLGDPDRPVSRVFLSDEQRSAIRHVLTSRNQVIAIRGVAGAGKTTLMQEAAEAIEAGGHRVIALAPTSEAAHGVLRAEGFTSAETVARFLVDERLQAKAHGQVLWIDEAGLLGLPTLSRVFALAQRLDARVVLAGDSRQHSAVERGDALRLLEQHAGLEPAEVRSILRQKNIALRQAVEALAGGEVRLGLERLERLGSVVELPDSIRDQVLATEYADALARGETVLAIAPTHGEGARVTNAIRGELVGRGLLGSHGPTLTRLQNCHWTEIERTDAARYAVGDILFFHRNAAGGIRSGERLVVEESLGDARLALRREGGERIELDLAAESKEFQAFRPERVTISAGERLRITRNGVSKDGHRLRNGSMVTVSGFTEGGDLVTDRGWVIDRSFGTWDFGYVTTSHASQGKTVDRVFIAESTLSRGAASAEQLYVSASRARLAVRLFTDDRQALRAMVMRSSARRHASDLVRGRRYEGPSPAPQANVP